MYIKRNEANRLPKQTNFHQTVKKEFELMNTTKAWKVGIGILLLISISAGLFYSDCKDKNIKDYSAKLTAAEEAYYRLDQEMEDLLKENTVSFEAISSCYVDVMVTFSDWQKLCAEDEGFAAVHVNLMHVEEIVNNYIDLKKLYYAVCYSYFLKSERGFEYSMKKDELPRKREELRSRIERSFTNLALATEE